MRKTLMAIHRWVALTVGLILLCTAASGAMLVFEGAIDRGLHPELWRVAPTGAPLPIDTVVARVEAQFPATEVRSVSPSSVADRAWTVGTATYTVFVNPYTGRANGTRTPAESQATLARRLHVFHVELFAGKIGRAIVGVVCAIALFLVITGTILWWPDKLIRINTRGNWKRLNFDLHHSLGIVATLILIVITTSGVVIHYEPVARLIKSLDAAPPAPPPAQPVGIAGGASRPSFDAIAAAARGVLPGAEIMAISLGGPKTPITVAMRFPEDRTPGGRSRVFVDRYSGSVLAAQSTRTAQVGTRLDNLKRSLHTGDVLGRPSEVVWLLATLVMISQVITGALMWWNARASRRRTKV